jgi:putative ABC transport system permease protein
MNRAKTIAFLLAEIRECTFMALGALASHKLRSALTLLGVLVGVFSIIVAMTAMRVMQNQVEDQMSELGSQTFQVTKWPTLFFVSREDWIKYWRRPDFTLAQGLQVMEKADLAIAIGLEGHFWQGQVQSRYKTTSPSVSLLGETPGSFQARKWNLQEGRFIVDADVDAARDVCVLGGGLAKTVFPYGTAVGERLKINGFNYTVVGVLETKGSSQEGDQDNFAIMPLTAGLNRFGRRNRNLNILVQARDQASYDDTVEQVRSVLRTVRKIPPGEPDNFEIFSNDSMIAQFNNLTVAVRVGVTVVSSIALLAAGIGIMNIMLVSVTERTREIGIRRAIGAKKRNIMTQFIVEAIVICEVGGVLGVILGVLGGNATAYYLKLPPVVPFDWIALGLIICSIVGIVFGTYPAYKAANLDPIESLRYE